MTTIRAATFNMKHGALASPTAWRGRTNLVREGLAQLDVDILALQEVDRFVWRSGFRDQLKAAAKATGMRAYFARTLFEQGGQYGNALLVRGDITAASIVPLEPDNKSLCIRGRRINYAREPRNALIARMNIRGSELTAAATHLAGSKELRQRQFRKVIGALACYPQSRILLGDLNTSLTELQPWSAGSTMHFAGNSSTHTNPSPVPRRQIDHIGVDGLAIRSVQTQPLPFSDHLALVAELVPLDV